MRLVTVFYLHLFPTTFQNPPRLDEEAVGGLADICSACHHVHHIEISEVPVQNVSDVTECESPDDRDTYSHLAGWRKDCV